MINHNRYKVRDAVIIYFAALCFINIIAWIFNLDLSTDIKVFAAFGLAQVGFIGSIIIYSKIKKIDLLFNLPIRRKISLEEVIAAALVTLTLLMVSLFPSVTFAWLLESLGVELKLNLPVFDSAFTIFAGFIIICILPAIGEEMLIRGVFVQAYRSRGGVYMILMSSLVFSLMHMNPAQIAHQFFIGIILSYIVIRTEKLLLPMIIHCLNNSIALFLPLIFPVLNTTKVSGASLLMLFFLMIAGLVLSITTIHNLISHSLKDEDKQENIQFFPKLAHSIKFTIQVIKTAFKKHGIRDLKEDLFASLPNARQEEASKIDSYLNTSLIVFLALVLFLTMFN